MDKELEEELNERLAEAVRRDGADLDDYLSLRASNDQLRERGLRWLNETVEALAAVANRAGAGLTFTRDDAHRFRVGDSTMVGTRLTLSRGVRSLTVEAGWPRAPRDGIVHGLGLARARLTHFGDRAAGEELLLALDEEGAPLWLVMSDDKARAEFSEERLRRHIVKLLGLK